VEFQCVLAGGYARSVRHANSSFPSGRWTGLPRAATVSARCTHGSHEASHCRPP